MKKKTGVEGWKSGRPGILFYNLKTLDVAGKEDLSLVVMLTECSLRASTEQIALTYGDINLTGKVLSVASIT